MNASSPNDQMVRGKTTSPGQETVCELENPDSLLRVGPSTHDGFPSLSPSSQGLTGQMNFEPSMFDPQNFPQLPQEFYDTNGVDFSYLDFFGGQMPNQ
jgi:hypothetical protein